MYIFLHIKQPIIIVRLHLLHYLTDKLMSAQVKKCIYIVVRDNRKRADTYGVTGAELPLL